MTSENKQTESPAAVVVSYLQSKLLAAANYIDVLGGDSKSYRVAIATELQAQPADALDAARYRVIRSMHDEMHPRSLVCLLEGHSWSSVADSATELDKFCDEVDAMAAAHAALAKHKQL